MWRCIEKLGRGVCGNCVQGINTSRKERKSVDTGGNVGGLKGLLV